MNENPYGLTADLEVAREFKRNPLGFLSQSPELQRILTVFRGAPMEGKFVLVCTRPHEEWQLGRLSGQRGDGVDLVEGVVFTSREEAEWEVFSRRWEAMFGERPDVED